MRSKIVEANRRKVKHKLDAKEGFVHKLLYSKFEKYIKNKKVIDIGCWTGQLMWYGKDDATEIVGIDPGKEAVELARKKFKDYRNIKFIVSKAEDLKVPKSKFDTAIMSEVIEHIPVGTESEVIKKVNRLLKMNGDFIITTPNKNIISILLDPAFFLIGHRHYSKSELMYLLDRNGFEVVNVKYFGGFAHLLTSNLQMIFKHIIKADFSRPKWLEKITEREFNRNGFSGIIVYSKKVKNI